ncbi:MAG: sterol desaturase family protein [Bacteriovoracaceae bacterium]|nr:sterol desaturase family protein [Bacteriovoracaceae bacterium]
MTYFIGFIFFGLITYTFYNPSTRSYYTEKSREDWFIDCSNLFIQGTLIPLIQTLVFYKLLIYLLPTYHQSVDLTFFSALFLNFIFIDYLYYWNHRLFHKKSLFPIHLVHHTAKKMDVFVTSRNTLWTSFFIVYLWINGLFIFLLKDPRGYFVGMALTAALDCWRHSVVFPKKLQSFFSRRLFLITPIDHAWHHSQEINSNFGANLNIFDKLHGTFQDHEDYPKRLGVSENLSIWQKLIYPYR